MDFLFPRRVRPDNVANRLAEWVSMDSGPRHGPAGTSSTLPQFILSAGPMAGRATPQFHVAGQGDLGTLARQTGLLWDDGRRAYLCPTAYHARLLWCYADETADSALLTLFPKLSRPARPIHTPYLIAANDRLICLTSAQNRDRAQAQGFRYDERARYWWTQDLRRAIPLADIAEPPLQQRLLMASGLPLNALQSVTIADLIKVDMPAGDGAAGGQDEEAPPADVEPVLDYDEERQTWVCNHPVAVASGFRQAHGGYVSTDFEHAARLRQFATLDAELRLQAEALIRFVPDPVDALACRAPVPVPSHAPGPLGPEQIGCVHFCQSRTGAIIADDMGIGKTAEAIGVINASAPRRALIIAPTSLLLNWLDECAMWLCSPHKAVIVTTSSPTAPPDANVVIVGYDALPKLVDVLSVEWDLLFADEGHRIKNEETRAGRLVYGRLRPLAARFYDLTGTPIWNRPQDLFAPLHAIAPAVFANKEQFRKLYGVTDAHNLTPRQRQRLDFLAHALKSGLMIRRLKSEVLDLLPKVHRMMDLSMVPPVVVQALRERDEEMREVLLSEIAKQVGGDAADEIRHAGKGNGGRPATAASLLAAEALKRKPRSLFAEIARLRMEVGQVKLPYVRDAVLARWHATGDPPVIFGKHRELLRQFAQDLSDAGLRIELLTGQMSARKRQPAVKRFQAGDVDGVVAGFDAAAVGFTLTRSSWLTMFELDLNPPLMSQAIDRAHRRGQKRTVAVDWAAIDGTIDSHIAALYLAKDGIAREALGDHLVGMFRPADLLLHPVFTAPALDELPQAAEDRLLAAG
jgi:hypothetical protein